MLPAEAGGVHPEGTSMKLNTLRRAAMALAAAGTALISMPAVAGEGHWSIGQGVQCRVILGFVICTKSRV